LNLAVFVSGRGSNLKAIIDNQELNSIINIKAVCSNDSNCNALKLAQSLEIDTYIVPKIQDERAVVSLIDFLQKREIELIVLAGYLKLIPELLVESFEYKIINIHPALLPAFGGKGMYGMNVHKAVFESSAKVSGATVHFVNQEYDKGKIIAQRCVDISDVKTPEEIAERVLDIEHKLLPYVIKKFAQNKIKILNNRVIILD
jgi:formyltetrahydrofolate-dependent phosphoribosylglycinamide formyltransferase